jgi:pilus assembly protein FimV
MSARPFLCLVFAAHAPVISFSVMVGEPQAFRPVCFPERRAFGVVLELMEHAMNRFLLLASATALIGGSAFAQEADPFEPAPEPAEETFEAQDDAWDTQDTQDTWEEPAQDDAWMDDAQDDSWMDDTQEDPLTEDQDDADPFADDSDLDLDADIDAEAETDVEAEVEPQPAPAPETDYSDPVNQAADAELVDPAELDVEPNGQGGVLEEDAYEPADAEYVEEDDAYTAEEPRHEDEAMTDEAYGEESREADDEAAEAEFVAPEELEADVDEDNEDEAEPFEGR